MSDIEQSNKLKKFNFLEQTSLLRALNNNFQKTVDLSRYPTSERQKVLKLVAFHIFAKYYDQQRTPQTSFSF